jgi:predicted transcriptional regulator
MSTVIPEPRSIATKISVLFESSRVEVLLSLRNGPRTARELGDSLDLSAVSIRKQLAILKACEVVKVGRSNPPTYELSSKGRRVVEGLVVIAEA